MRNFDHIKEAPAISSKLRKDIIELPKSIQQASGIRIFGRLLKSFVFSTDVATIMYTDADAILAVYSFSPHPAIIEAVCKVAYAPIFAGVGGGTTSGQRSVDIALFAEAAGVMGVVVNAPMPIDNIQAIENTVDSPIVGTIVSAYSDIDSRLKAGVDILNVSGGRDTPAIVRRIRESHPDVPIIATGGKTDDSILEVIEAGANAISWTPPSSGELFRKKMDQYRAERRQTFLETHEGMTLNQYAKLYGEDEIELEIKKAEEASLAEHESDTN